MKILSPGLHLKEIHLQVKSKEHKQSTPQLSAAPGVFSVPCFPLFPPLCSFSFLFVQLQWGAREWAHAAVLLPGIKTKPKTVPSLEISLSLLEPANVVI